MKQLSFNLVVLATEVKVPPNITAALRADNINLTIESAYPNASIKSNSIAVILVTWLQYTEMAEDVACPLIIIYPTGVEEAVYKLNDSRIIDVVCQTDLGRLEFVLKKWVSGDVRNPQLKKITKALAIDENAERLNLVIEASNAGVWDWNIDTNEEFFSAKWCEIIGYQKADAALKHTYNSWAERIHPDHKESVFAALKAHLEFNTPYDVEYLHLHKSGEYRWQKSIGKALYNEIGRPIRMVGSIFDINERKKAEAALEESKENYRKSNEIQQAIISALPDLMLRISATGEYLDYHAPDHSILYRKPDEFIGKYASDILPAAVSEILMNGIKEVLEKKHLVQLEYELDFGHELRQFEGRMMPINKEEVLIIIRDVTERNQAVDRIKKEEERFQLMVENSNDIFIITQPEKVNYVSPNVKKVLGYTAEEFTVIDLQKIIHPNDFPHRWNELSEPGSSLQFEYRIKNKQNEWRWIEAFGINLSHLESVNGMVFNLRDITEKKEKEAQIKQLNKALGQTVEQRTKELQKSETLLQEAERIAKLGSWEFDLSTEIVTWSNALYEIFAVDPNQPVPSFAEQKRFYEREDWEILNKLVQRAIEFGEPYSVDLRMLRADGSKGFLLAKGEPQKNEDGVINRLVGIAKDITERKTAEELVQKLTNRLEQATKVSGVGVWEWNVKTNELIWNDTMYQIFGIEPALFTGIYELWESTIYPEDLPLVKKEVAMAVSGTKDFDMEFRIIWPDKSIRYIKGNGTVRKDENGLAEFMIGTNWDITESKKADELVREQRQTFEFILEQSFAGYWDWTVGSETIYVSDTYKKMLGYENEPSFNTVTFLRSIIDPDDHELLKRITEDHFSSKGEKPFYGEVRYRHKNGGTVWVITKGAAIKWDETGRPLRMIGCQIDITKRKMLEADIEKNRKELEAFSYSVSHDLRAPLRGIDGWSLALLEDYGNVLDEKAHQYLSRVRSETQRMGQLIDDLLQLSRVSRIDLNWSLVDFTALAYEAYNRIDEAANGRRIEMIIETNMKVWGDTKMLDILLTNLLSNAIKFTGRCDEAKIEIGTKLQAETPVFYIKDNGAGFDMNHAKNLFGAFQRLHKQSEFPGTGIGLAIVQRIVNIHSGSIWAEAQPGRGACFFFTLNAGNNI
ncbi:MAG: PAS domain S-box protein [Sphingobacteriales bacterium]|nr:MAG: PAS domain S-box protein [Sphingobacteriales bacterium]